MSEGLFLWQARMNTQEHDEAKADFEEVLKLDPNNKAARNQIILCNQRIKQMKEKEKRTYAGMFTKFAEIDAKVSILLNDIVNKILGRGDHKQCEWPLKYIWQMQIQEKS